MRMAAIAAFLLTGAVTAEAAGTSVRNDVSVSARAGSGGAGQGSARVEVQTTVNGEVVEQFEETRSTEGGEPVEIRYEHSYAEPDGAGQTDAEGADGAPGAAGEDDIQFEGAPAAETSPADAPRETLAPAAETAGADSENSFFAIGAAVGVVLAGAAFSLLKFFIA